MSFLAPLFLLGSLLIAGPILFHFARNSSKATQPFSAIELLEPTPEKAKSKRRIQNIWLLLLRCLILALLAIAFARPFLETQENRAIDERASEHVAILLDISASMLPTEKWINAQALATQLASELSEQDSLSLIAFSDHPQSLITSEQWKNTASELRAELLKSVLHDVHPQQNASNLGAAILAASQSILDSREQSSAPMLGRIEIVSDFVGTEDLHTLIGHDWPQNLFVNRNPIQLGNNPINLAPSFLGKIESNGTKKLRIGITGKANNSTPPVNLTLRSALSDEILEKTEVVFHEGSFTETVFDISDTYSDEPLKIVLSGDSFPYDNALFIAPTYKPQLSVFYLSEQAELSEGDSGYFAKAAGQSFEDVSATFSMGRNLPSEKFDLYLVSRSLDPSESETIRKLAGEGSSVLFLANDNSLQNSISSVLKEPIHLIPNETQTILAQVDFEHPYFRPIAGSQYNDLTKIQFWKSVSLSLSENTDTAILARFENGSPVLIEKRIGSGRTLVWGSSWSTDSSQWALSSKFLPWYHELALTSVQIAPFRNNIRTSDSVASELFAKGQWKQIGNDPNTELSSEHPQAGLYQLDTLPVYLSVRLPASESEFSPLDESEWTSLGIPDFDTASYEESSTQILQTKRLLNNEAQEKEQSLWKRILLAVAILLALESILAFQNRQSNTRKGEAVA